MATPTEFFAKYPELAVYLALGLGYWVGNFKVAGISLGGVTGSLLAGIGIGYFFHVPVAGFARSLVFMLFLFAIGYSVGPKFFKAMKGEGWKFGVLGAFVPLVGLATAIVVAKVLDLDPGFSGGLVSGALTESPAMGTATEAIQSLEAPDELKRKWISHVAVADALCYLFGAIGVIVVCSSVGPRLLRIDLKQEAAKLEALYGIERTKAGVTSAWRPFEVRSYKLAAGAPLAGRSIAEAERMFAESRLFIQRLRRGGSIIEAAPAVELMAGDVVAVGGRRELLVPLVGGRAEEVDDRELTDLPVAAYEVFVRSASVAGRTLEDIAKLDDVRGVYLRRIMRGGQEVPVGHRTVIERGDVLHLTGPDRAVERAAALIGEIVRPSDVTDFVILGLAICLGAAIGALISIPVGTIKVSLGASVGALLTGVLVGYVRSVRPLFGRVPDGAVAFMQSYGLAAFVAMVGIGAGPEFVVAIREAGVGLLIGGVVVTVAPLLAGLYFGKHALELNPVLLLGGLSGAQTFAGALAAVQEKSGSTVAVLGYSGAVAVAHILLTTWGTIMVLVTAP